MPPRTPLFRPDLYFAQRQLSIGRALVVVAILTVALLAGGYAIGWIFTTHVDGTVTIDNPARPSDAFCSDTSGMNMSGCDEPSQIERNIDSILQSAVDDVVWQFIWIIPLAWLFSGVLLHTGSWLAGGEGSASRSFVVAAWGMAPILVSLIVVLAVLALTFEPVTVTPADDPAVFRDQLLGQLGTFRPVASVVGIVTVVWSGVIWKFGLQYARNLSPGNATIVAGVVTLLSLLSYLQ